MKNFDVSRLFQIIFACVFALSAFMVVFLLLRAYREQKAFENLAEMVDKNIGVPEDLSSEMPESEEVSPYIRLKEQNDDFYGWISIEGTRVDYPVMHTPDNPEYYLRRGFDRLYATSGSLFLDERCRITPDPTANWLIYGHNMADGSMFGELDAYADEDFWREHPTFTFDTLTEPGTWAVVAVLRTELGADELPYYTFFDAADRADWQARVDAILALALYDTGVKPEYGDQLLTLSTCGTSSVYTDARFALLAVRVA